MSWQDIVIGTGQALFVVALLPALRSSSKPPRFTCALTGLVLAAFALCFASLGLWYAFTTAAACSLCWLLLLAQQLGRRA